MEEKGKLNEECGLFGICLPEKKDVMHLSYYALYALQHRGQQAAGIAVATDGAIACRKGKGLTNEVFSKEVLENATEGNMAIAHCLYGRQESDAAENAQPLSTSHLEGRMAIAMNGALTNGKILKEALERQGCLFHTSSDCEIVAYQIIRHRLSEPNLEKAIEKAMDELEGAFSILVMSPTELIAARDPFGFRPLVLGTFEGGCIVASETCALDSIGAGFVRDIRPGEILVMKNGKATSYDGHCGKVPKRLCVFEHIYFARPDSFIDGASVQIARQRAGAFLALEHPVQADVVVGVPDSGIEAAMGYAKQSGIPYGIGFIKNKYIGRTFIAPGQRTREDLVRMKLNPVASTVKGKRVVLVDDSIVRGTTSRIIVKLLREAGAREVHLMSSAPKFLYPCFYGTDISSSDYLIAYNHTDREMEEIIGVDSIGFLSVENVVKLADNGDRGFCTACFDMKYPTKIHAEVKRCRFDLEPGKEDN